MPTTQEISDLRKQSATKPSAAESFGSLISKLEQEGGVTEIAPATQQEAAVSLSAGPLTIPSTDEIEPPHGVSPKALDSWKVLKASRDSIASERDAARKELQEARAKLEQAQSTGTPNQQAVAQEEYDKLKNEVTTYQSKTSQYENDLKAEREQRQKIEAELQDKNSKLSKLSLDFDPDFQERYIVPFTNVQNKLSREVKAMTDTAQQADQVNTAIYAAIQQPNDDEFYKGLRQLKQIDPENYASYAPKVQQMRDLLIDRLSAMENHEKTAQSLRAESYKTRERTVPEVTRRLTEVMQDIETATQPLTEQLRSEPIRNFLKSQNIDQDQINSRLEKAVRDSHSTGEISKDLLYFAAQGVRHEVTTPFTAYMKSQADTLQKENAELKAQIESMRTSQGGRPMNGNGGAFQALQPPSYTPNEIRRMTSEQRNAAKTQIPVDF